MIVAVFRARLHPDAQSDYAQWARRMSEIARAMPGYISHKGFAAEDGERVTIVEFESEEALRAWSVHPEHVKAKKMGRQSFYAEYEARVCRVIRESKFKRDATAA